MGKKVAVIGGGSVYVAGIIRTLLDRGEEFAGARLVLEDLSPERQETMLALGRNLVRARRADLKIEATLSLDEALDSSDFVITCFRVGGRRALQLDVSIPAKHDIYGDETAGPGGIFFALRTAPVVVDIAKRMEKLCPQAYLINYANPTAFVADAVRRMSCIEELSLCSGGMGMPHMVAEHLGHRAEDVIHFQAGVNHFTWLLKAYVRGRDVAPDLVRKLASLDTSHADWGWKRVVEIIRTYQRVPIPGSHMVDYFFRSDSVAREQEVGHWGLGDPDSAGAQVWAHYQQLATAENPQFDMSIPGMHQYVGSVSDLAVSVIAAIVGDRREIFTVNLPNIGQIANLPRGEIVEGPAVVGAFGAQPIAVGDLPETVLPMTEILARTRKLAVDAALSGDKTRLLAALMSDPLVDSITKARPMMEEMLTAQAEWLPQFAH
jgi:6-phospho-beta-glucosidase